MQVVARPVYIKEGRGKAEEPTKAASCLTATDEMRVGGLLAPAYAGTPPGRMIPRQPDAKVVYLFIYAAGSATALALGSGA